MSYAGMQTVKNVKREQQLRYEEGKSPAAWAGSWIALIGFVILTYTTTFGFEKFGWMGVYISGAMVLIGGLVTLVMKVQGYGTPPRNL
ncbi:hypothetical protein EDD41_0174 [Luteococcus japonicus]|uniref:Uncharacterized protein n=1 Tax=Luteococcus japonicus TaxID=33984 RepID=A0A3N1ZQ64_9ACTN|nr:MULTISPECIES: HGxxPAAW family protein [Luteococcus]MDN5563869.1 hypothetical protein [Luteococcus sp.]ROR53051.1 hypothetical protein EDD41_0174 [Luteococcus japonicus]